MDIDILYEDRDILVINKPAGLLVHGDGRNTETTLVEWIRNTHPYILGVGENMRLPTGMIIERPGIVHRIDKDTSGVLVISKTPDSFLYMKHLFQARRVQKRYQAFVYDNIKETEGVIDKSIGRHSKDFRQWSAEDGARGERREAVTRWKKRVGTKHVSFLDVYPETGRTHQIRVHLKYIEHPLVCDSLYAPNRSPMLGFKRLALHAYGIVFEGSSGTTIEVEAPYPDDFKRAIEQIETIAKEDLL